ncbi:uncharacterized protein LOC142974193 [Anticarsia gemmatalis]|uniref:uncharacterized protein LOC142974193 n=1 Tax=Anticarsia gemmatalis TaxID=129554 RepID=UPI003F76EC78
MYFKIVFFVATLCVVNASVITNNVYDDDDGFIEQGLADYYGIETGEDDMQMLDDSEVKYLLDDLEDADLESTDLTFASKCRPKRCKRLCRVLGKDGSCVDGKCKCVAKESASDRYQEPIAEDTDTVAADLAFAPKCRPKRCERICRALGKDGSCVDGKCKCVKKEKLPEVYDAIIEGPEEVDSILLKNEEETGETNLEYADLAFALQCRPKRCERFCRLLRKTGSCVDGKCKCVKKQDLTPTSDDIVEVPEDFNLALLQHEEAAEDSDVEATDLAFAPKCQPKRCERFCRLLRKTGSCVDGKCKCVKKESASDNYQEPTAEETDSEAAEPTLALKCRPKPCERFCRLLRKSGSCIDGKCKCVKKEDATENVPETNTAELLSETEELTRNCNHRACDRSCRRRGYRGGGLCINRRCVCRSPPTREDLFLINDATDDVSEELN